MVSTAPSIFKQISRLNMLNGQTVDSLMLFEEIAPADTETPLHTHADSDEIAYVLSGEITFKIGDEATSVGGPGTCAFMPRGLAHAWKDTVPNLGMFYSSMRQVVRGRFFEEAVEMGGPFSVDDPHIAEASKRHG